MAQPMVDFTPVTNAVYRIVPIVVIVGFLVIVLQSFLIRKVGQWGRNRRFNRANRRKSVPKNDEDVTQ